MTVPQHWKGVGLAWQLACEVCCQKYKLSVGWWYNWLKGDSRVCLHCGRTVVSANSATFVPMSWSGGDISDIVSLRPTGSYYLIYNEPDNPTQAGKPDGPSNTPVKAADRYFDVYRNIKAADDTAQVGGIGLVYIAGDGHCDEGPSPPRPAGQDYLVAFLNQLRTKNIATGGINAKLDFYHVHAYFEGPGGFCGAANSAGTAVTFERLKKHLDWVHGSLRTGYETELPANVPVWITETSHLGRTEDENRDFMDMLWSWLRAFGKGFDQNVKRIAWFSTYVTGGHAGTNLFKADLSSLTNLGKDWLALEDNFMAFTGDIKTLVVQVTGSGTRYKDYTWNHGMGSAPIAVVPSMGMTGVGEYWVVNTYNPSTSQVKFRISHVDGVNWANTLTLTAVGFWN